MQQPLISIIVPCYNVEKYLPKCVESILAQTYKNLEIFLVDDGSPDRCGEICDKYATKDSRIKVIHKENGGLSDARNVAIDVAQGEYITFVDSDDYVAEDYVAVLYKLITENDCQMSVCWYRAFKEGTEPTTTVFNEQDVTVLGRDEALKSMFYQKTFDTAAWAKMYHRSLFECIRYPKGWLFEDLPTTYLLIKKCKKVAFSHYMSYYYLLRNGSIEGEPFNIKKYDSCVKIISQLKHDKNEFPHNIQKALNCRMVSFLFHILLDVPLEQTAMRKNLLGEIKQIRWSVLLDMKARKKARFACLFTLGGLGLVNQFASLGRSRK